MYRGSTIMENVGQNGSKVVIPVEDKGYGGFYMQTGSNAGESYIIANP